MLYKPVHTRLTGSGLHLSCATHTAIIVSSGEYPSSQPKVRVLLDTIVIKPFTGSGGGLQKTEDG